MCCPSSKVLFQTAALVLISFALFNIMFYEYETSAKGEHNLSVDEVFVKNLLSRGQQKEEYPSSTKVWRLDHKPPRRFFAFPNGTGFYAEPKSNYGNDGFGDFDAIPSYPYTMEDLIVMNATDTSVVSRIQKSISQRLTALLESDSSVEFSSDGHRISSLPKFLPPQFPQNDRSLSTCLLNATYIGFPPTCCPLQKFDNGTLVENKDVDCTCRSPTNYPVDGSWPKVTLVSAFYEVKSLRNNFLYKRSARQITQSSDPLVIFVEPGSEWETYFTEQRRHAPTMIVPRPLKDMVCSNRFPLDDFWQVQHERLDPERNGRHKGVSMN